MKAVWFYPSASTLAILTSAMTILTEDALSLYAVMARVRGFEEKVLDLCRLNKVPGITQLCIGQEAIAAGSVFPLRKDDYVLATYRGHGHAIAKGTPLYPLMAEILGRKTGCCKGKGGPMHLTDVSVGNPGLHPIVGAQIPIGCGVGMAMKRLGRDSICLVDFGDGAAQTGIFHESFNLAVLWKLPVVFTCSNNLYAVSVPFSKASSVSDVATRAIAYGMPYEIVDGQDVSQVYETVCRGVTHARDGNGPFLIECKTYRFSGHSQFDADEGERYRSRIEIEAWKQRDPLKVFRKRATQYGISVRDLDTQDQMAKAEVEDATQRALNDPLPEADEAFEDIYA